MLEWIAELYGFAAQATSYLSKVVSVVPSSVLHVWLTLENIQADAAEFINVRVKDLGEKANLWWSHRVVIRQEEL